MSQPVFPAQPEQTAIPAAEPERPWWVAEYETYQRLTAEWDLVRAQFTEQRERRRASLGYRLSPASRKRRADELDFAYEDHAYEAFLDRAKAVLGTDLDFWFHQYLNATDHYYEHPDL